MNPSVFIGSATEGIPVAYIIRRRLNDVANIDIWNEVFQLGNTTIQTLIDAVEHYDFAVFVFTKDDLVKSRDVETWGPRDNVIFELGLFTDHLGTERSVIVWEKDVKIPSDLAGLTMSRFERPSGDVDRALIPTCDTLREMITRLGRYSKRLQPQERQDILESKINRVLVETSMSDSCFSHLAGIYLLKHYFYREDDNVGQLFQRELYHLKHHGMIRPETQEFYPGLNGKDLVGLVQLTEAGENYIRLRKDDIPKVKPEWFSPEERGNLKEDVATKLGLARPRF